MLYAVNQFFSMLFMLVYGFLQDKLGTRKHLIWLMGIVITLSGPFLIYVYEPLADLQLQAWYDAGSHFLWPWLPRGLWSGRKLRRKSEPQIQL